MQQLQQQEHSASPSPVREQESRRQSQGELDATLTSALEQNQLKHLQGLNSLELLYKVLIHHKEDQLCQLELEKAQSVSRP